MAWPRLERRKAGLVAWRDLRDAVSELRRRSGLKTRHEVVELPTLQDIYLAIVGNHAGNHDLAETRSA